MRAEWIDKCDHEIVLPQYVGKWLIGGNNGLSISVTKKPRWLTRWFSNKLLEWEWVDL